MKSVKILEKVILQITCIVIYLKKAKQKYTFRIF